jgi:quinol monooxygenase YgiN
MAQTAILVRLEAQPGKGDAVAALLEECLDLARAEGGISSWYALRLDESNFGLFEVFADAEARDAHFRGRITERIAAEVETLLTQRPIAARFDVLGVKLPH